MGLGMAPLFFGTFPLFLLPVSREFGWGAAIFPQSIMIAGCVGALMGPVIVGGGVISIVTDDDCNV